MQTLTFTLPNDLSQLHDELIAAIPSFHRNVMRDFGLESTEDSGRVEGAQETVIITFADDVSPGDVAAVVGAHRPVPRADPVGDSTRSKLRALGFSDAELDRLL